MSAMFCPWQHTRTRDLGFRLFLVILKTHCYRTGLFLFLFVVVWDCLFVSRKLQLLTFYGSFLDHVLIMCFKYGFLPGCPELVFVSHVIHPCHFYVRKYSQIKDATVLEKKMKQVCNKSLHLDPSDILELGKDSSKLYYHVCFKYCNIWPTYIDLLKDFF